MKNAVALMLAGLVGCESQVYTPDGGSPEGGAPVGTASGGASSVDGGGPSLPPGPFDAVAACAETCNRPCVGDPSICEEDCVASITPNCERESFALHECSMWYCDPTCDTDALEMDLLVCVNPFYCGHAGNDFECVPQQDPGSCDCIGQCNDGHLGEIVCTAGGVCDCYFDGELVATCSEDQSFGCDYQSSCCIAYLLPGGGPAAGE